MSNKTAFLKPEGWDSDILPQLKQLNYGDLEGPVKKVLNDPNKIIFSATSPSDNPNAAAWVTTEDVENGKIESIHINATKVPKPGDESKEMADQIIASLSALVSHEVSHAEDFRLELFEAGKDPFPKGEAGAEEAERQQEQRAIQSLQQAASTKNALVKLSNNLDNSGNKKFADSIDNLLLSLSKEEVSIIKSASKDEESLSLEQTIMFGDSFYKKPFGR